MKQEAVVLGTTLVFGLYVVGMEGFFGGGEGLEGLGGVHGV